MVMQARKLPRLSDGYFDRNQTHSYDNSSKYSKSDRNSEKVRASPIISNSDSRNENSENRSSPRYHRPCSQRLKDKDHHEDSSKSPIVKSEAKCSSNKDHKSQSSSDRDTSTDHYQTNHDRNDLESEKRLPVGDWSEHISSSGKKYYYNCKTEVSQWEKPKELIEWERQQNLSRLNYDTNRSKDSRGHERPSAVGAGKNTHSQESMESSMENSDSHTGQVDNVSHRNNTSTSITSTHPSTTNSSSCPTNAQVAAHLLSPSQVTLSNLPKLISQLAGTKGLPNLSELSPQEALRTIQQALQLTKQVTNLSQATDSHHQNKPSASPAQSQNQINHHTVVSSAASNLTTTTTYQVNSSSGAQFSDSKEVVDRDRTSPSSDSSTHSIRHDSPTSSVSSLHSLNTAAGTSSLATAALKPSIPSLTPSLANYYREDLISHVVGWQADHAERQANRYWEEAHNIGSLNCTQVSAELKMARALVRLAEIQATLQEQRAGRPSESLKEGVFAVVRVYGNTKASSAFMCSKGLKGVAEGYEGIQMRAPEISEFAADDEGFVAIEILFLRQQTKELEEWRSLNSFMGDS